MLLSYIPKMPEDILLDYTIERERVMLFAVKSLQMAKIHEQNVLICSMIYHIKNLNWTYEGKKKKIIVLVTEKTHLVAKTSSSSHFMTSWSL